MKVKLLVLLAVHNGATYLSQQINSIKSQTGPFVINILSSDDHSTDNSKDILNENAIKVLDGPRKGAASNFVFLIDASGDSDFYSFADQDDIWDPDKIQVAVETLQTIVGPALYVGSSRTESGKVLSPKLEPFPLILMRNRAQGCTMMFNAELMEIVRGLEKKSVLMHDWWVHIIATLCGEVYYDKVPRMTYRLHESNDTGIPTFRERLGRFFSSVFHSGKEFNVTLQVLEIIENFNHQKIKVSMLENWMSGVSGNFYQRLKYGGLLFLRHKSFVAFLLSVKIISGSYLVKSSKE